MADTGKTIALVGALGAGGYLIYEYMQYNNAVNALAGGNASQVSAIQTALPFFTYLGANWGGAASLSVSAIPTLGASQQQIYGLIQAYLAGTLQPGTPVTPGTTSAGQTTTVSTAPPSTTTTTGSSSPTTTTPPPPAPAPISRVPITSSRPGLAVLMQQNIQMSLANADQWNYAYGKIMGQGVDKQYGFNFDTVYGPVVGGVRRTGTMSAQAFLQLAASAIPGGLHGLGTIATYGGTVLATQGNMLYAAHHQFPYVPTYTLRGLSAVTQASGFEKALFTNQRLRSNRLI